MSRILLGVAHLLVYICFAVAGVYAWRLVAQTVRLQVDAIQGTQQCADTAITVADGRSQARCLHYDSTTSTEAAF